MFIANQNIQLAEEAYSRVNPQLNPPENVLELGGAGGVTKHLRPNWTVSDVRDAPGVDISVDGTKIPFIDSSLDMIVAIDVIHHIFNTNALLEEVHRVLKPNGIFFLREPYWSLPAQFVWRFLHPEDWSLQRLKCKSNWDDPMFGNQALAQALIAKPKFLSFKLNEDKFQIYHLGPVTGLAFLLSGGATFTTKIPRRILIKLARIESRSKTYLKLVGFGTCFYFVKK